MAEKKAYQPLSSDSTVVELGSVIHDSPDEITGGDKLLQNLPPDAIFISTDKGHRFEVIKTSHLGHYSKTLKKSGIWSHGQKVIASNTDRRGLRKKYWLYNIYKFNILNN